MKGGFPLLTMVRASLNFFFSSIAWCGSSECICSSVSMNANQCPRLYQSAITPPLPPAPTSPNNPPLHLLTHCAPVPFTVNHCRSELYSISRSFARHHVRVALMDRTKSFPPSPECSERKKGRCSHAPKKFRIRHSDKGDISFLL